MLFRFAAFEIDDEIFALRRDGIDLPIRPQALDLLIYLVRHRQRVVSKRELIEAIWRGASVSESTLPQAMVAIRRALEDRDEPPRWVQTSRGRGYRFIAEVEESPDTVAPSPLPADEPPYVGRDDVLRRIDDLVNAGIAARAKTTIALISGEAGVGKSRTLSEFSRRARERGLRVLEARCHGVEGAPDLWPWTQLLRAHAADVGAPAADVAAQLARELVDPQSAGGRFVIFDRITQILECAAQHEPLVLCIDDVHRADAPSLLLLKLVASSLERARAALLVTYREGKMVAAPSVFVRTLGALAREKTARSFPLDNLSPTDVTRLAESCSGTAIDTARLMEKTNGNPLLLIQILRAVEREASTSALLARGEMREAIALQLEGISQETQAALSAASVWGPEITLARLAATLGGSVAGVLPNLEEALSARVLAKIGDGRYRFLHVLVRDVLYRKLSLTERVSLHKTAGMVALDERAFEDAGHHFERVLRELDRLAVVADRAPEDDEEARAFALLAALEAEGTKSP
jgi:DNA-binding winged helix-turn-helix (wHTH) protein/predicted ATPase